MVAHNSHTKEQVRVVRSKKTLKTTVLEIYSRRELLVFMVKKELSTKYRNSTIGFAWSMLNPAFMLAVYYFVFSYVMHNGIPEFVVYLMGGFLAWNFFSTSVQSASGAVVENAGLVKKVSFPREVLALAKVGQAMVFFVLQLFVLALTMAIIQFTPNFGQIYLLVPAIIVLVVFTSALCILVSALNVFYRDVQHFVEVLMFGWFFGAPIVYSFTGHLANGLARYHLTIPYMMDPIATVVMVFDRVLYGRVSSGSGAKYIQILPNYSTVWYLGVMGVIFVGSLILMIIALKVFSRLEVNFAEEL